MEENDQDKLSVAAQQALTSLIDELEREDASVRKRQLQVWKKAEYFWDGLQHLIWSEYRDDYISPIDVEWGADQAGREQTSRLLYDFVTNIYRPHGESIIAALATQIPAVRFVPDDADADDDVLTARTYSKIADLIQRHVKAKLVFIRSLFILFNQSFVAAYNHLVTDPAFGYHNIPKYAEQIRYNCDTCGTVHEMNGQCPECGGELRESVEQIFVGEEKLPKSRTIIEVFGPLHVKVPHHARDQKGCEYLILATEHPASYLKSLHPSIADKIEKSSTDEETDYRAATWGLSEDTKLLTMRRCWLRPWAFKRIGDDEVRVEIESNFPQGCYVCLVEDVYAESYGESLDDRWDICPAGLSSHMHPNSMGNNLISIQERRNTLGNLVMETIEHGIPSSFADPEVIDFDAYNESAAAPGILYPAKARPGSALNDAFFTEARATLSREVEPVQRSMDQDAQFTSGSFPSIYGGPSEGKSRTLGEYSQSRQMALQRLSIVWTFLTHWWASLMHKSVKTFISGMLDDERFVNREGDNYVNVWIRRSMLIGQVGEVEPEASESFPYMLAQKRDAIMRLIELQNEYVNQALYTPDNSRLLADIIGIPELKIPGDDQRMKQSRETQQLLLGPPITDEMTGEQRPTILPEDGVDDDAVHAEVLRNFLVNSSGLDAKRTNPEGYANCVLHLQMHVAKIQPTPEMQPAQEEV